MKAIVYTEYGSPDVLKLKEVEKPTPKDNEVLVKVYAVSLNASDMEFLTATPAYVRMWGLRKPKYTILGSDIAGQVEAVGNNVTQFKVGDEVFGDIMYLWGGLAEYVCVPENLLMLKPDSMTFEEVSTIPQSGSVALQSLRNKGQLKAGQKLLINGAGGGTGTFAIQIAKSMGAEVTGIDNSEKLDLMRSLGADHVIDYTKEDFSKNGQLYDLIVDFVAHRSIFDHKRVLSNNGMYVLVGGSIARIFQALIVGSLISISSGKKMGMLAHQHNKEDFVDMIDLFEANKIKFVIDKCYPLSEVPEAFHYIKAGHAKGKVVINVA